ncbi:MAG TPA: Ppx/GppA phosphatase family protein [Solirubrobacteraceae bacterium]|jgi:exopolyphosphatase/guanosine-5'-triphosphate,3'-diphosphate pyrophosphatase|nr:Ppx/GppA phosphatase family protein [Solirubrobacteraceae bacterium]
MRVGVVDIGTNSTRLLICDVLDNGSVIELDRRSEVTRLGEGVDVSRALNAAPMERVFRTLEAYREALEARHPGRTVAVMTSAVRDASNGEQFAEEIRRRFGVDAHILSGDEEAQLTFRGAMSERRDTGEEPGVVIDIGGGSTELIIGHPGHMTFHVSLQIGVVRLGERHIHSDPPRSEELQALAEDARGAILAGVGQAEREEVAWGVAVAGTPTAAAAIEQHLDPYDPARVHGFRLELAGCELLLARLAAMTNGERRQVVGLHPDRAPVIVPGLIILIEAMRAFGLEEIEVSEHDILRGAALVAAGE